MRIFWEIENCLQENFPVFGRYGTTVNPKKFEDRKSSKFKIFRELPLSTQLFGDFSIKIISLKHDNHELDSQSVNLQHCF